MSHAPFSFLEAEQTGGLIRQMWVYADGVPPGPLGMSKAQL